MKLHCLPNLEAGSADGRRSAFMARKAAGRTPLHYGGRVMSIEVAFEGRLGGPRMVRTSHYRRPQRNARPPVPSPNLSIRDGCHVPSMMAAFDPVKRGRGDQPLSGIAQGACPDKKLP